MKATNGISGSDVLAMDTLRAESAGRELGSAVLDIERDYRVTVREGSMIFTRDGSRGDWAKVDGHISVDGRLTVKAWASPFCPLPAEAFALACEYRVKRNAAERIAKAA